LLTPLFLRFTLFLSLSHCLAFFFPSFSSINLSFRETFRRSFTRGGGIGIVEMLFRCNLLALVGGGSSPRYPQNKVMIWDDHQNRCIGELSFRQRVEQVKLRRDRVVVALLTRVYVYRFSDLALLDQINTLANPKGLLALSPDSTSTVLACPSINRGHVRVELYDQRKSTLIPAHEADLGALALNLSGTRLATASEKGTLVRVFDTHTGQLLRELRRGTERACIQSISFNNDSTFVACSSDKGTVHIFSLMDKEGMQQAQQGGGAATNSLPAPPSSSTATPADSEAAKAADDKTENKRSGLGFVTNLLPAGVLPKYFESEWSFAQVHGIDAPSICAFGAEENTIIVIGKDGSFLRANFAKGGEAERISYNRFLKTDEEEAEEALLARGDDDASSSGVDGLAQGMEGASINKGGDADADYVLSIEDKAARAKAVETPPAAP
jgi:WD40 repeat protein